MAYTPRRKSTIEKYKKIQERYRYLYNEERKRLDDVITQLCDEFFMNEAGIWRVLRTEI